MSDLKVAPHGAEAAPQAGDVSASVVPESDGVGPWTRFMDMHSGGDTKLWRKDGVVSDSGPRWGVRDDAFEAVEYIFIEAAQAEAEAIFYKRFGRNPERVTCTCCGPDYSINESPTLAAATAYERNCAWNKGGDGYVEAPRDGYREYQTVEQFLGRKDIHVIRRADIKPDERKAEIPQQGYVWCD